MTLILDAGALVAVERGDRNVRGLIARELLSGGVPRTHGGVIGQVWRGGSRQARLARALRGTDVVPLGEGLGREAGLLLAASGQSDVIDAALVALCHDDDVVLTSNPGRIALLAEAFGVHVEILRV